MKQRVFWGVLLTWLTLSAWAQDSGQAWKGRYRMWFSGDASWHQNSLEIESYSPEEIEGQMEIDLGLGPEGRPPNPDETRHKIRFKARREADKPGYVSEVLVGSVQPRVYRFEFYPFEDGKSLAGIVTQGNHKTGLLVKRD